MHEDPMLDAPRPARIERDGIADLWRRLEPRLVALAMRFVGSRDAAEDVVQTAFEKVVRHRERFRGEALPSTWIHRIVVNEAMMWLRSEKRRAERLSMYEREPQAAPPRPDEVMERRRARHRLRAAFAQLSASHRSVLESCLLHEMPYARFAEETGTDPLAVKSRAFRARLRLRALLGEV